MSEVVKAETGEKVVKLSDTVDFIASYPKDYAGQQYMKAGKTYKIHRMHAERLADKGLGKFEGYEAKVKKVKGE